ncbi:hypothetical protein BAY13_17235 [Elizabethkingia bruuniana]|uniref:hypothetical protein n=1 Tax=Elizabethkingia bruuniana TaxID=1756149 RepID=UPI0009990A8A|nr:hypothetical protein [Elizabethkingia bruuniana]OPC66476.1 hypothetical protein BAY13_17235 [Elizabethkingia bruuniana]
MKGKLPELEIDGTKYLFDINQLALVEKDNPGKRKLFFKEMTDCGTHYEFVYNRHYKCLDQFGTQEGIGACVIGEQGFVNIKVPRMGEIDPEGMSKKYHCSLDDIHRKSDFEIMAYHEACDNRINKGMLPTIDIAGHTFYVDIRMDMLRPKDDFLSKGIVFSDIETYYNEDKRTYTIPYNPKTPEFQEPDYQNIKDLPKDLIAVEFPSERLLDRIGWNRKYGFEITHGLNKQGLTLQFTARKVPWKETFLVDLIASNNKGEKQRKELTQKPK